MKYEEMLDRLYMSMPAKTEAKERFEVPPIDSLIQGNRTIWKNFGKIVGLINREDKFLFKFIVKDLGSAGVIEEGKIVFTGKFIQPKIQQSFDNFMKEYVLCHVCGKPDTKFETQQGVKILKCTACGAMSPLRKI